MKAAIDCETGFRPITVKVHIETLHELEHFKEAIGSAPAILVNLYHVLESALEDARK